MDEYSHACARRHAGRLVPSLLVAVLMAGLVGAGATVAVAPAATAATAASLSSYQGSPAMAPSTYARRVRYWINRRRHQHGLHRLRLAACTDRVAKRWGRHLAIQDSFYHQSMTRLLYRCNAYYAGETLGRGAITPKRLVYLWMHSPEHREVLLSRHARRIGIGCYPDQYGRWVTAVDYMHF